MADPIRLRILAPEDSIQRWKPDVTYIAGQQVVSPAGIIVAANVFHVSGASFDGTLWTPVLFGVFVPAPDSNALTGSVPTVQADGSTKYQLPPSGGAVESDSIVDSSEIGREILTAADAATVQSIIGSSAVVNNGDGTFTIGA